MIYIFVGHRGTGKSRFLKHLQTLLEKYHQEVIAVDLDQLIEIYTQKNIKDFFEEVGERVFRDVEQKALFSFFNDQIVEDKIYLVALGAGYKGALPENAHIIWLQRSTDHLGRIFLDRPRLEGQVSPLEEYFIRYKKRNIHYQNLADESLHLPENYKEVDPWLPIFWGLKPGEIGGCLTLLPWYLESKDHVKSYLSKRLQWGVQFFELRSDLLSLQQIHWLKELIPDSMILLSIRGNKEIPFSTIYTDWALELGAPSEKANIVSLHERKDSFTKTVETFKDYKGLHWKLAVEVKNWQELQEGYEWWQEDTQNRSFLPRSTNGRWSWFRLLHKYNMKLNFFREDIGSSLDQPYLVDWCNFNEFDQNQFGAVLGDPILHSWTPEEQRRFWSKDQCNSLKISLSEEDWTPQNLGFLKRLGMKYAAVTTPLKSKAYEICDVQDELSNELQSVNTLLFNNNEILGMNTDFEGLKTVCESQLLPRLNKPLEQWKVGVWGGGGTLAMIKKLFPQVVHFSARTGKTDVEKTFFEKLKRSNKYHFDVFIWAVGRERIDQGAVMPSQDLSFEYILDLNYAENSPGKELALMQGTQYISGEAMFLAQADLQRKFWSSSLT